MLTNSPYLSRPLRSYQEASADVVAASSTWDIRLTDERMTLLEMIERELKRRERSAITKSAA